MRNLSKVLALVLSLAFVLTMFAGAAFIVPTGDKVVYTDADAFDAAAGKEAVRILTALGIVKGYPEGDFQPAGDVTRAEFAKMVALAKTGKTVEDDTDFNFYDTQIVLPFTDVADGDWFKGYVNYAYLNFILAGYGDGTLRPKNNVTGVEAVKMALVALGYDPKVEGLEGADWARNTITLAGKTNLLKDLAAENMYAAFDREATAILIWNALNEKMVAYNNGYIYFTGKTLGEASAFAGVKVAKDVADKDKVDLTKYDVYYLDGKAISADEAKAALAEAQGSSAPVQELDGAIYFYSYDVYKVKAVDGNKLTLWGKGDVTVADAADIAADDFIVLWSSTLGNKDINFAKELEVVTGKVTAYTINSKGIEDDPKTAADEATKGLDVTKTGGKYTINGKQYTFGTLADEFDTTSGIKDESDYFAELLGKGSAAVNDAELTFIVDGNYIVAVFVNENTYWENYAIVIGYNPVDTTLGLKHIRLLTDDNEYKDFYVASVDGNQIYNNIVSGTNTPGWPARNTLVRYEDLGNNKIALYNIGYANAVSDVIHFKYTPANAATNAAAKHEGMEFDPFSGNWEGHKIASEKYPQQETTFTWENGVVFVTYEARLNHNNGEELVDVAYEGKRGDHAYLWRAYRYGEFQPDPADKICTSFMNCDWADVVCANSLNNNITLKAAAIAFKGGKMPLPGLPLRAGQIWGTLTSVTDIGMTTEDGAPKFAFKFNILNPWSTTSSTITIYADYKLQTGTKGDIYKLYVDEDGVCRRFEIAKTAQRDLRMNNNYLEIGYYNVTNATWNAANNGWYLTLKRPNTNGNNFSVDSATYFMPADADAYFVKGLFTTDITALDYVKQIGSYGIASLINNMSWEVFADINPTTKTINSIWFNENAGSAPATFDFVDAKITVTYNANKEEVTYTIDSKDDLLFANSKKALTVAAKPYELKAPIGTNIEVTLTATLHENGGWYVEDEDAITGYKWQCYDKTDAGLKTFADRWNYYPVANNANNTDTYKGVKVYFGGNGATNSSPAKLYKFTAVTGTLFWYRENFKRTNVLCGNEEYIDALYDGFNDFCNKAFKDTYTNVDDDLISYNYDCEDGTAYDYEQLWVMVKGDHGSANVEKDALTIVMVDIDNCDPDAAEFPYDTYTTISR